ncbi:MAG: hypothetical protein A4E64_01129 [Syntrophorhabdus sp. PtaU1.Bin058]|nr:MAG: hypothetical protein A4E64_01129 [Syntrophorhabdus sp. PtaU1.Bin058]
MTTKNKNKKYDMNSVNVRDVQELPGHKNVKTPPIYICTTFLVDCKNMIYISTSIY